MLQFSSLFSSPATHEARGGGAVKLEIDHTLEDCLEAFCTLATMQSLGCFHGAWVEISHDGERGTQRHHHRRPAQLLLLPDDSNIEFGTILVTRTFAFNLCNNNKQSSKGSFRVWPLTSSSKGAESTGLRAASPRTQVFSPAKTVTIARVRSDLSDGQRDYSEAVKAYFFNEQNRGERVMRAGDVFLVKVSNAKEEDGNDAGIDLERAANQEDVGEQDYVLVPFQVTHMDDNQSADFASVSSDTMLKLQGSVSSAIPPSPYISADLFCHEQIWRVLHGAEDEGENKPLGGLNKPRRCSLLLCGPSGSGKQSSIRAFARREGVHYLEYSLTNCRGLGVSAVQEEIEAAFEEASQMSPSVLQLSNFDALMVNKQRSTSASDEDQIATLLAKLFKAHAGVTVVALATTRLEELPSVFRSIFLFEIELVLPDLQARTAILRRFLPHPPTASAAAGLEEKEEEELVPIAEIAQKTAGKSARELKCLVSLAAQVAVTQNERTISKQHLLDAIELLPNVMEELSGAAAPKIPDTKWDDVGGLSHAKEEIMDMVQMPLKRPDLFQSGMRSRSGILLFGPPGTGKTLLAKAVATECAMNFISVKGPELLDMYIGESERKVRAVFETARAAKPCVLFFDELDSLAPQRGKGSDSGGVMDRVVSQLLTEIDGMSQGGGNEVFIIGATNRPDLLDSSLLRPGRFDRLIYLGICQDVKEQAKICQALTRKYVHEEGGIDFERVLANASRNLTGADFYALCSDAMASAMKRKVDALSQRAREENIPVRKLLSGMDKKDLQVVVSMQDYEQSMAKLVPSVSESELVHYETLRVKFSTAAASAAQKSQNEQKEEHAAAPAASEQAATDDSAEYGGFIKVYE